MKIKELLASVVAGELMIADVVAMTDRHEALRGYELWKETEAEVKAYWAILAALPKRQPVAYRYDAEVERMQTGRDPLDEGE